MVRNCRNIFLKGLSNMGKLMLHGEALGVRRTILERDLLDQ
jgi:hypothetical protein